MSVSRFTLALVALLLALAPAASAKGSSSRADRHVMSFNLRYASDTPPNAWPQRRPVMRQLLQRERPDIEAFDATARANSARLMLERFSQFDPALPVIATGDFNETAKPGLTVYDTLLTNGPLEDSWVKASKRSPLFATFHGYQPLTPNGDRIDWILTSPTITTREASINTFSRDGQFPSDHLPVQAALTL